MRLGDVEVDHIIPASVGGDQLQILCAECHKFKSIAENECHRRWSPFTSTFNAAAHQAFASAEVPRTPPVNIICGEINQKEAQIGIDLRRSRANAMRQPGYAWSVFSVYDNIVPSVHGELREWSFVDREVNINRPCDLMRYFPYCRKGWLHKCVVAYLLDRGKIQWEHIKFSFQPTTLLPADAFKNPIDTIVEAQFMVRRVPTRTPRAPVSITSSFRPLCSTAPLCLACLTR